MRLARALTVPLLAGLAVVALVTAGCGGSTSSPPPTPDPDHDNPGIVLKDRLGNPLTVDSTEPYSPRQTCGTCHDVNSIARGYHFTQGRTNAAGVMQMDDDFFNDQRDWLKSDGMYGKW